MISKNTADELANGEWDSELYISAIRHCAVSLILVIVISGDRFTMCKTI